MHPGRLPRHAAKKDGVIINIVSIAWQAAVPLGGERLCRSQVGPRALGAAWPAEEKDSGIRICSIYPGEVDTPILGIARSRCRRSIGRRILNAEDIAEAVLFVAPQPKHVTIPELIIKPTCKRRFDLVFVYARALPRGRSGG